MRFIGSLKRLNYMGMDLFFCFPLSGNPLLIFARTNELSLTTCCQGSIYPACFSSADKLVSSYIKKSSFRCWLWILLKARISATHQSCPCLWGALRRYINIRRNIFSREMSPMSFTVSLKSCLNCYSRVLTDFTFSLRFQGFHTKG